MQLTLVLTFLLNSALTAHTFDRKTMVNTSIRDSKSFLSKTKLQAVQTTIKGQIKDANGQPVTGATISLKGSNRSVQSDQQGNFEIQANMGEVLVIVNVGYTRVERAVQAATMTIVLQEANQEIEAVDVVATGYQTIDKRLFTGSSASVKMDDIRMDGVPDVSRMLEGRVAGVSLQNVSGTFGSGPKLRIRGATSISGDNKPLWVIDGVVLEDMVNVTNDQLSSGDALTLLGSSVAGLNVQDIESLEILKDASATAMYGARAMNGVVVVTTKKGRSGPPQVTYSGNYSTYLKPSYNTFDIMNSRDQMSVYAEMYRKGLLNMTSMLNAANGGVFNKMYTAIDTRDPVTGQFLVDNTPAGREKFLKRYANANTDWFDLLFNNSFVQDHSVSISSGSDRAQHYFSGSFFQDSGWTIADNVKRFTANSRSNYQFTEKFNLGFIVNGNIRQQQAPGTQSRTVDDVRGTYSRDFDINPFSYALNTSRALTAYDENGDLEFFTRNYAPFNILHEVEHNYMKINVLDFRLQGEAGYKFLKNLDYNVMGNIRYVNTKTTAIADEFSNTAEAFRMNYSSNVISGNKFLYNDPDYPNQEKQVVLPEGGFYTPRQNLLFNFIGRQTLSYKGNYNDVHYLNAFAGQEMRVVNRENENFMGVGYQYSKGGTVFTDPRFIKRLVEGGDDYFGYAQSWDRFVSFFGNIAYSYKTKYVVNVTGRYDGTNKFGIGAGVQRWLPTYTISGAYNIHEEEGFKDRFPAISNLKLRGGYGLTASMGNASNFSTIFYSGRTVRALLKDMENEIYISSVGNRNLTWEKQHEINVGLDLSVLRGRLDLVVDYFRRNGFDLINWRPTSGVSGFTSRADNYADMVSNGVDLMIGGKLVNREKFKYSANVTFSYVRNKITNLDYNPRAFAMVQPEGAPILGGPVRGLYSFRYIGLDANGNPQFINQAGNTSNTVSTLGTDPTHMVYEGSVDPIYTGGLNNSFTYGRFTASVFFSYQAGNKVRLDPIFREAYSDMSATSYEFINRWGLPGDELYTDVPGIPGYATNQNTPASSYPMNTLNLSSMRVVDGSFVRLKTIAMNYAFDAERVKRYGLKGLSLGFNANNIWLVYADKRLKGQDPEFFNSGGVANPLPRQFNLSLKVSL